jgi:hypothetical protein
MKTEQNSRYFGISIKMMFPWNIDSVLKIEFNIGELRVIFYSDIYCPDCEIWHDYLACSDSMGLITCPISYRAIAAWNKDKTEYDNIFAELDN